MVTLGFWTHAGSMGPGGSGRSNSRPATLLYGHNLSSGPWCSLAGSHRSAGRERSHVRLILLQNDVARKLGLGHRRKLLDDVLEGLEAGHAQLVAVVGGRHEGHADQVREVEDQEVIWGRAQARWDGGLQK